jgi:heptosyltransferase I
MPRILLVKTSSLGDVVHNLPVASDIAAALPEAEIDWVVEENFAAIPKLHQAVNRVIPIALRRWRRRFWQRDTRRELLAFFGGLRRVGYDAIVDTQGLLKSALITGLARGRGYGLDWKSSREPLSVFYKRTFPVAWQKTAVERNRALAAQALRYTPRSSVRYGISAVATRFPWLAAERYAVLIHATSARPKLWPEEHWIALGQTLGERGITSVLPWGSAHERERSDRLARSIAGSVVPPPLQLADVAALLVQAQGAVGVDTGLTHLAGALRVPTVGIYIATDPRRTGLYGCERAINVAGSSASPTVHDALYALERLLR